jgi:signal transduction histidine kinase
VRIDPIADDEIGRLTEHFNSMVETIRLNAEEREGLLKQINQHNEDLKQKVHNATEELLRRNEDLLEANHSIYEIQKKLGNSRRLAAVGQVAATVAHELGTPLHSISGHLQLLMEDSDLSRDKVRRLEIMQSQLERIIESIQDILDTTRQPSAKRDIIDLNSLLEDISILVLPEAVSKEITVRKDLQKDILPVFGSTRRLEEAFLNLIDNAIDASQHGSAISISTKTIDPPGEDVVSDGDLLNIPWVRVSIKDKGRGIPEEHIRHIFRPFYTTKSVGQGTGLGLAISQEIIESHKGFITVESALNHGSTFNVCLPTALRKARHERATLIAGRG